MPAAITSAHNDLLLGRDASAFSSSFLLGGQVLRHQTSTRLGGENSNLRLTRWRCR